MRLKQTAERLPHPILSGKKKEHKGDARPEFRFLAMSAGEEVVVGGKVTDEHEPSSPLSSHGLGLHRKSCDRRCGFENTDVHQWAVAIPQS